MIQVQIIGLDKLVNKARGGDLLGGPLRRAFTDSVALLEREAKQRAPVDTGRLRSSITHAVDTTPVPLWGKVGTRVFYAPIQEEKRRYLRGAFESNLGKIQGFFAACARAIEASWGK